MAKPKPKDALFWGAILILIGGLLLLRNFHIDAFHQLARLWPVILIAWGGWKLFFGLTDKKQPAGIQPKQGR